MAHTADLELVSQDGAVDVDGGSLTFIGTATVLIRYAGFTLLTDPNFLHRGEYAHLGYGLRSRRLTNPAMRFEELPPCDLVLLSHLHEDHFDRTVAERLVKTMPIITTAAASGALARKGFRRTFALATWERLTVVKNGITLTVTAMPGRHGPAWLSWLLPPVMGGLLEFRQAGRDLLTVYVTGDTLVYDALKEIPRRYPAIDQMLLHLGGTRLLGVLVTMNARQGVEMVRLCHPNTALPFHYDDYTVFKSPLADFELAVRSARLEHRVHVLRRGERFEFVPAAARQRARSA